jgi:hypothetical protein
MGGNGCRDKNHFLKAEGLQNFFCPPEVAQMDGIKSPPKKPNPLAFPFSHHLKNPKTKCQMTKLKFQIKSKAQISKTFGFGF